jgi:hypothetical protein
MRTLVDLSDTRKNIRCRYPNVKYGPLITSVKYVTYCFNVVVGACAECRGCTSLFLLVLRFQITL